MDVLAQRLDAKLREWKPEIAEQVRQRVTEIIESADQNVLDVMRSRAVEQEVLDLLDEPATRPVKFGWLILAWRQSLDLLWFCRAMIRTRRGP